MIVFQQSFPRFVGSICGRRQNKSDKFTPISVDIKEELQISLFFALTFVVNCPYELMTIGSNSKTKKNVVEAEPATEQERPKQTLSHKQSQ